MADEQNVNDATPAIDTLCDEADALHRAGRLEDAIALLTRDTSSHLLARADEQAQLRLALLRAQIHILRIFHANRGFPDALASLDEAQALAEKRNAAVAIADTLDQRAHADYYQSLQEGGGDYAALLERFSEALTRREALNDTRGVAESLFHVGLMHERLNEPDRAGEVYERAYALAREHRHKLELSYVARHLGGIASDRHDLVTALAYFEESLALRQDAGYTLGLPLAHIALGDTRLLQRDVSGAAQNYQQARALAEGMQSPLATVFALLALSALAQARDDEGMGRDYAEQALSRAHKDDLSIGIRGAKAALAAIA